MCQEKNEEEDFAAFKITSIHRFDNSKTTQKDQRNTNYSDKKQKHKEQQNSVLRVFISPIMIRTLCFRMYRTREDSSL